MRTVWTPDPIPCVFFLGNVAAVFSLPFDNSSLCRRARPFRAMPSCLDLPFPPLLSRWHAPSDENPHFPPVHGCGYSSPGILAVHGVAAH
ncbi:hypothetical protein M413DRAFT_369971 [Hebeloma cylindrosporum]|uniref:Uncharacterized protein n=1 Tax=Hebeloma cylindrosporum TaxID=76867 RepID=A0A0C2XAJ7_HEBCY|nr:hypothetical protein M413DRAFT_369971 [Hebeloma cylindrosporum h7]